MAIPFAPLPAGTRVQVRRGTRPIDPVMIGRTGIVVESDHYRPDRLGVVLDGEGKVRVFAPGELEVTRAVPLPPEVQAAWRLRALP